MGLHSPSRAVRLTLVMEADTVDDLASQLHNMSFQAQAGMLTKGVSGGPSGGSIYELLIDPEQTHERYFEQVREYLAGLKKDATP